MTISCGAALRETTMLSDVMLVPCLWMSDFK